MEGFWQVANQQVDNFLVLVPSGSKIEHGVSQFKLAKIKLAWANRALVARGTPTHVRSASERRA